MDATKQTRPVLTVPAVVHRFALSSKQPDARQRFEELLRAQADNTDIRELGRVKELLLSADGRVQGRYRWTSAGLSQLCAFMAPGLSTLMQSIVGPAFNVAALDTPAGHDPALAIRLLNEIIRLRFERLDGYQLVIDKSTCTIVGLVGRKYGLLPNIEFYERVHDFVTGLDGKATFIEGILSGRRLLLRYCSGKPVVRLSAAPYDKEVFLPGVHFSNSETGDCSVRGSVALIRKYNGTGAISTAKGQLSVQHVTGSGFDKRLNLLMERLAGLYESLPALGKCVKRLAATPIGLGGDYEAHKTRLQRLRSRLQQSGLRSELVKAVTDDVMLSGSYNNASGLATATSPMETFAERTVLDLFNVLTFRARLFGVEARERVEQIAYGILTGKLNPV